MKYSCIFVLIIAVAGTAFGFNEHRFCIDNTTGETIEVCIYPYNRLYYETDTCFWVRSGEGCMERTMYFEDGCSYEICGYGSDGREYGCLGNNSCASAGYSFSYAAEPYICDSWYCDDDTHWVIEPSASVSCFISAVEFE